MTKEELLELGWVDSSNLRYSYFYLYPNRSSRYSHIKELSFELTEAHICYGENIFSLYVNQNGNTFTIFSGKLENIDDLKLIMRMSMGV